MAVRHASVGPVQAIRNVGGFWAPYLTFITFCMGYATIAGCLVSFGAPLAAGSGIPEVKTYLNGVHIKGWRRSRLLVLAGW